MRSAARLSWEDAAALAALSRSKPLRRTDHRSRQSGERARSSPNPTPISRRKSGRRLADGTPLVTAERHGNGLIILVHVTANADWSNLPLVRSSSSTCCGGSSISHRVPAAAPPEARPQPEPARDLHAAPHARRQWRSHRSAARFAARRGRRDRPPDAHARTSGRALSSRRQRTRHQSWCIRATASPLMGAIAARRLGARSDSRAGARPCALSVSLQPSSSSCSIARPRSSCRGAGGGDARTRRGDSPRHLVLRAVRHRKSARRQRRATPQLEFALDNTLQTRLAYV